MNEHASKTVSAEEAAKILHISKRKCSWMLKRGLIPCKDTEKKTRRYTILLKDVYERRVSMDEIEFPQCFSSNKQSEKKDTLSSQQIKEYVSFLVDLWHEVDDVLTAATITDLLGYNIESVRRWCRLGKLKSAIVQGDFVVAKSWLADFCCHYGYRIVKKSEKHKSLEKLFFK